VQRVRYLGAADDAVAPTPDTPESSIILPFANPTLTLHWHVTTSGGFMGYQLNGSGAGSWTLTATTGTFVFGPITAAAGSTLGLNHTGGTSPGKSSFLLILS
jgi:hypothetical protein